METVVPADPNDALRVWWNVSAMLVILMQVGFVCLEMGCVREHNRSGIALKNFMILIVASLVYSAFGYKLMYGDDFVPFTGVHDAYGWLFFQTGFCVVSATIISGALAGRTSLLSNVIFAFVMSLIVYPVHGRLVWGGGWHVLAWFETVKIHDFAGSGVVHLVGGTAAFIGALVAGPRYDWRDETGTPRPYLGPRSLPLTTLGVVFLWIGWIGFNGGSGILGEHLSGDYQFGAIGAFVLATSRAASAGALAVVVAAGFYQLWFGRGKGLTLYQCLHQRLLFDPYATLSGAMGGMVAVTANCDWILADTGLAVIVGAAGGLATFAVGMFIRRIIDDPVEAVAVHAGGGAAGILLATIAPDARFHFQLLEVGVAVAWTTAVMLPLFWLLRSFGILRCTFEEEVSGLSFEPVDAALFTNEPGDSVESST